MYGKKTVIKYNNGKIVKGYTTDFSPAKNTFHLKIIEEYQNEDQVEQIEIAMTDIKAVFFVKDFQGNIIRRLEHLTGILQGLLFSVKL